MEDNWRSIFEPAIEALAIAHAGQPAAAADALMEIAGARTAIEEARIGDGFNVGGELFPKVSADRKTAAAFYTTSPTAEFLVGLTIRHTDGHDWANPELLRNLHVADLACGTGTLLRAAWRRIRSYGEARGWNHDDLSTAHRAAMEEGIVAADVSPIAAHLANSGMALAGSGEPYRRTRIGWVEVGLPQKAGLSTGSLEFLGTEDTIQDAFWGGPTAAATRGVDEVEGVLSVNDASLDYIIMNPPYSRTRGGQSAFDMAGLTEEERQLCQKRWGWLLTSGKHSAIKTAGMAASFLCIAWRKIRPGGRIGFVLPRTAAFEKSWDKTRAMICREFENLIAITTTAQTKDQAYSADTGQGEMLLVATRRKRGNGLGHCSPIACVTLRRSPLRQGEAGEFAWSVLTALAEKGTNNNVPIFVGDEDIGQIVAFQPQGGAPWSPLDSLQDTLALEAGRLSSDGVWGHVEFPCRMTTIGDLFEVGPTHHLIGHKRGDSPIGAYRWMPMVAGGAGPQRALWAADAQTQRQMRCQPTHRGVIHDRNKASRLADQRGYLHYSRSMRWTSQKVLAASTDAAVFGGSAWTTLRHDDDRVRAAFALWANSIFGLLVHWTRPGGPILAAAACRCTPSTRCRVRISWILMRIPWTGRPNCSQVCVKPRCFRPVSATRIRRAAR